MLDPLKIKVSTAAGFCFGVRDAIEKARSVAREYGKVYLLGEIVHNERVVAELAAENIKVVTTLDQIKDAPVLFRAHGTTPAVWEAATERGLEIIDATCPLVHEIHREIRELYADGRKIFIIGDHDHDEVNAIRAQVPEATVISTVAEAEAVSRVKRAGVVSQSTQMIENVQQIIAILTLKVFDLRFVNTVCFPTRRNQEQIKELAPVSDVMIIVGSFSSANTKRLLEVSQSMNPASYMVASAEDIQENWFDQAVTVGISAGASSPDDLIQEVVKRIKTIARGQHES